MITIQTTCMAPLPCNMHSIKSFAVSKTDFLFLNERGLEITKWSISTQTIETIKLDQAYSCFCYDSCQNCFWAIAEHEHRFLYQLNTCFNEIGRIEVHDISQQQAISICYDACENGVWIAYPNEVAFINLCTKTTNRCQHNDIDKCNFAVLLQCGYRVNCYCDCERQFMEIQSQNGNESMDIAIPIACDIVCLTSICHEKTCACYFYALLLNTCSNRYIIRKYKVMFCDETTNPIDTFPCFLDKQCGAYEIMHSIALEEAGISHILNAEGEKIQKALAITNNINELVCINESVKQTLTQVSLLEGMLYSKLEILVNSEDFACDIKQPCHLCNCLTNNHSNDE